MNAQISTEQSPRVLQLAHALNTPGQYAPRFVFMASAKIPALPIEPYVAAICLRLDFSISRGRGRPPKGGRRKNDCEVVLFWGHVFKAPTYLISHLFYFHLSLNFGAFRSKVIL
jgi:hypothetical protein